MDLTSSLEAKFGARSGLVHQIKEKTWEVLLITRHSSWGKIPILGSNLKFRGQNLGYLSPIFLEAKFGAPIRICPVSKSEEFQRQILGQAPSPPPPRPPDMEVPPALGFNALKGHHRKVKINKTNHFSPILVTFLNSDHRDLFSKLNWQSTGNIVEFTRNLRASILQ